MHSSALLTIAGAVLLLAAVVLAQDNYVDDYDQDDTPVRSHSPSFRRPSAPQPSGPRPAPVAILKQIDKHNDDGSYTYGYEGADGSFKIETKLVTGEVMGKYGYVDDAGKVRVVEYGANRYGFMPAGEGITVAPPTLVDETTRKNAKGEVEYIVDDGQYYRDEAPAPRAQARPAGRPRSQGRNQHVHIQPQNLELPDFPEAAPAPQPAPRARPSSSGSPVPPRPQVPGAVPVFSPAPSHEPAPAPVYEQHHAPSQHRSFSPPPARAHAPQVVSRPPPPPPQQPSFASFDSWSDDSPAPAPVPVRSHRPAPPSRAQHARSSSSGILDQLERDYALPSGGRATHDISFGSF